MEKDFPRIKCVIVGDGAVGKTCLLITYTTNKFPSTYIPTVFDNYAVKLNIGDTEYVLGLFDTAGQEDYDRLRPLSYPETDVFLVCFNTASMVSFDNVKSKWHVEVTRSRPGTPCILVGLQSDRRDELAQQDAAQKLVGPASGAGTKYVTLELGNKMAHELGMVKYMECSAKIPDDRLKDVFDEAIVAALTPDSRVINTSKKCTIL